MAITAVVGCCWGDEGKGKMADWFAGEADAVVRFQGGGNAGHTIVNEYGKHALHLLPSGVFRSRPVNILGPGVAVDPWLLLRELDELAGKGVHPRVLISERAQVVLPVHRLLDRLEEERLVKDAFGSTRMGIAPFYADKAMKINVQMADLFDGRRLRGRIEANLTAKNVLLAHLYRHPPADAEETAVELEALAPRLREMTGGATALLGRMVREDRAILLEGQLGALRDPDHGITPYTTSSSPLAGYGLAGAGLPARSLREVAAVVKAYATCVGAGPFVTEIYGGEADLLRRTGGSGGEYGATTGRPRRMGWFDAVAARYGCALQGATCLALTNLDTLSGRDAIPVCESYRIGDELTGEFPAGARLERARPVYRTVPGWREDIRGLTRWEELPAAARAYVELIGEMTGVPVKYVSTGPERDALIVR